MTLYEKANLITNAVIIILLVIDVIAYFKGKSKPKKVDYVFYLTNCVTNQTIDIIAHDFSRTDTPDFYHLEFYDKYGYVVFDTKAKWDNVYRGRRV